MTVIINALIAALVLYGIALVAKERLAWWWKQHRIRRRAMHSRRERLRAHLAGPRR